jgi:RNA polymerase sigma-70 factor (ECF subfamily)
VATRRTGRARAEPTDRTSSDPADEDGSLLVRATCDPQAFADFYDRRHGAVMRYFLHHTGSAHLAAELTAETFAQALATVRKFDPARGTAGGWLFGLAATQYHRYLRSGEVASRHRRRLHIVTPIATVDEVERVIEVADAHLLRPQLLAAMDDLSDTLRSAVVLRVAHDLPYAEVAQLLGCTEGTARIRVARGLRQLTASMVAW